MESASFDRARLYRDAVHVRSIGEKRSLLSTTTIAPFYDVFDASLSSQCPPPHTKELTVRLRTSNSSTACLGAT